MQPNRNIKVGAVEPSSRTGSKELLIMKGSLNSWKARVLWDRIRVTQPGRFERMVAENSLVPLLNEICSSYYAQIKSMTEMGLTDEESSEIALPLLLIKAGL